jgi:hypothetical protein
MIFDRQDISNETLLTLYKKLVKPRLIEEKMLIYLRQGKISKWFSGWGQEGISVGCAYAMNEDEYILPMHRNLGVFTTRNVPLLRLFAQFQGKMSGYTKGRDRSFHFGTQEHKLVGMISHLGFGLLAILWIFTGYKAYSSIIRKMVTIMTLLYFDTPYFMRCLIVSQIISRAYSIPLTCDISSP